MRTNWFYALVACILIVPAFLISLFPLNFIKSGIGQEVFFWPVSLAVHMSEWYWDAGIRYDCSNILLFGYKSSFSIVVPATLEETKANLAGKVADVRLWLSWVNGNEFSSGKNNRTQQTFAMQSFNVCSAGTKLPFAAQELMSAFDASQF